MPAEAADNERRGIRITGLVQGVGFRPTVWRLAREERLAGYVLNDGQGVAIEVTGSRAAIERFCQRLIAEAPPLAKIARIDTIVLAPPAVLPEGFVIGPSIDSEIATGIVPDWATCPACLAEVRDARDRRHGYAFTNCTHCGPRLSIIEALPYDRRTTTMARFKMCPQCQREYDDPADRRFHAQPNACPACGPRLSIEYCGERDADRRDVCDPIGAAAALICAGGIVAVKGIGGFHIACDATSESAVGKLRRRKARHSKPLAVMVRDMAMARSFAQITPQEEGALQSGAAPIVLVQRRQDGVVLADGIAPGQSRVGIMLPYTPLHHLQMAAVDRPLVMTSGNLSGEPQCTTNEDARTRLAPIADAWLMHDRDIANRLDDSVVRIDAHGASILRRARGYAPAPIPLDSGFAHLPAALAFGGELKATFCFTRAGAATLSQHLGDLDEPATCSDYRRALDLYRRIYAFAPQMIAVDRHPDYASSRWGEAFARDAGLQLVRVQHHHAHLAAVMAENGLAPEATNVLGIILDGTGLGEDGAIWGGEFLLGGYSGFMRVGHFEAVALPGGEAAVREPWRNTYAHLRAAGLAEAGQIDRQHGSLAAFQAKPLPMIEQMVAKGINAPLASSAGRLFDAVAGALGVCADRQTYEGEAAMRLESLAAPQLSSVAPYVFAIIDGPAVVLSFAPMWVGLVGDVAGGADRGLIAARFHRTLIAAVVECALLLARRHGAGTIALSGGVFQNRILLDGVGTGIERQGLAVLRHRLVPANDGGLSLGQAVIAACAGEAGE